MKGCTPLELIQPDGQGDWMPREINTKVPLNDDKRKFTSTWMSQEVSKWLGSGGYNPNIPHL